MDLLVIPKKSKEYRCKFAAPSILTGRFVAQILNAEAEDIRETLTDPGKLIVLNEDVGEKEYEGYTQIYSLEEGLDGGYIVKLTREENNDNGEN